MSEAHMTTPLGLLSIDSTGMRAVVDALADANKRLEKAATQFAFYAREHAKKGTAEADEKAEVNRHMAAICRKEVPA